MAHGDPETGWRGRLAEMEEQLHALAAELAEDLGEDAPAAAEPDPSVGSQPAAPDAPVDSQPSGPDARVGSQPAGPDARVGGPRAAEPVPPLSAAPRRAAPAPPAPGDPTLEAMCARLLASMRELLAGYELALTHVSARPGAPAVTVAAGPFASVALLARFEDALRALPDVRGVSVRGYEGADRALLEVHLEQRVS